MALNPPDMDDCAPKALCLSGPNEGLAYDPSDPCPSGTNFDALKCDCIPIFPSGAVQWRMTGGNTYGRYWCPPNNPSIPNQCPLPTQWADLVSGPYYSNGVLVNTLAAVSIAFPCPGSILKSSQCLGNFQAFPQQASVYKSSNCNGGQPTLMYVLIATYNDGVFVSQGYHPLPPMDTLEAISYCDTSFSVGYTWTANFEYRTSDGQGGWLPGIQ